MDVFLKGGELATRNLTPGIKVYGEELNIDYGIPEGQNYLLHF